MSKLSKILTSLLIITILLVGKDVLFDKELYQGEIAVPVQRNLKKVQEVVHSGKDGEVILLKKAEYELTGVVKSKKKYSDFPSQISEYDLAIAWGSLNKAEIDSFIKYSQRARWYYYRNDLDSNVSNDYISKHSANTHIIHKDKGVLKKIKKINKGDYVKLKGFLVDVDFKRTKDAPLWKTSTRRNDLGDGACEIFYVEELTIID